MRDSWKEIKLVDLASFRRGSFPQPYGLDKWYDDNNGMPFIQVFDVDDNMKLKRETKRKISKLGSQMSVFIPKGTLILTIQGSIGRVAITDYDAYMDRTLLVFQKFYEEVDLKFIMYIIRELFKEAKENANGSTIKTITKEELSEYTINLPPLPQQRKIANILSTCDDVIEKTEAAIAKYQALKQGMMHDLFTRGIDLKTGKLRPRYQDAPELYKECELGMIPKEWEKCTFKDISSVNQGLQIPISLRHKTEGVNRFVYITIQYLNDIENEANRYYIENPTTSVVCNEDDVLMVRTGNTGMIVTNIVGAFHNNFFKIDYGKNVVKEFLVYHLKRKSIQSIILNYAGTTTIPDLKHGDFYNLPFMMPSQIEQKIISTRLEGIDNKLQTEQSALAKYQQIKAGLMQDLLTGKVEVREESKKIAC
jgi:type I restriction enzyme S subunit